MRRETAKDQLHRQQNFLNGTVFDQFFDSARRDFFAGFSNYFAGFGIYDVIQRLGAFDAVREKFGCPAFFLFVQLEINRVIISIHDAFLIHAQRIKQSGNRQFPATVNTGVNIVFGVKFKIKPRTAIGDNTAGEQQFARTMGFAFVMVKKYTRGAVHLGNNHPLGAIDNKRADIGHQGHIAHEYVLFFDVFYGARTCVLINIKHDQTQRDL